MATFKLGAVITDLAGSVGGTTFKRSRVSRVMMNKTMGGSYGTNRRNDVLPELTDIFRRWGTLTQQQRDAWNLKALEFTFPDKFGDQKNLTGRELFTKINGQLLCVGIKNNEAGTVNSAMTNLLVTYCIIDISAKTCFVNTNLASSTSYLVCQFEVYQQSVKAPFVTSRKVTGASKSAANKVIDLGDEFWEQFPYLNKSYAVRLFFTEMNDSGFRGVTQIFQVTIED